MIAFTTLTTIFISLTILNPALAATTKPKPEPNQQRCGVEWGVHDFGDSTKFACLNYGRVHYQCEVKSCWVGARPADLEKYVLNDHLTFSDCLEYDGALGSQKTKPGPSVTVKVASYKIFYKDGHADVTGVDVKDKSAKAAPLNWKCTLPKGKGAVNNIPTCEGCKHMPKDTW